MDFNAQKRFLSLTSEQIKHLTKEQLLISIKKSEGRIVVAECLALGQYLPTITNAEIAKAFGADIILLNLADVFNLHIDGLPPCRQPLTELKRLIARPIGVNLEPVDESYRGKVRGDAGRLVSVETLIKANDLGFDFICLTGNPQNKISNQSIIRAIRLAKKHFTGAIFAGKMHSAGIDESLFDLLIVDEYINAGADVILLPAVMSIREATVENAQKLTKRIRTQGRLSMATLGTSQESSNSSTIESIALANKMAGFDLHHIGDAGVGGVAPPENIMALSIAIRGKRHTYAMMAQSVNR